MDPQRWRALQDLFLAASEADDNARRQLLTEHERTDPSLVAEVRALLDAHDGQGPIDRLQGRFTPVSTLAASAPSPRLGPWRIVREIGRGGMGVVYLAERADEAFRQQVAIKLLESSDESDPSRQRFLTERHILAALVHPNITRLRDAGVTDDGYPYLVMDLVDGEPITAWCDRHRLDVPARLRVFVDVCAAVQHAHQSLVIHRDLKPSNILVDATGRVQLLDFGIAKLLEPAGVGASPPQTRLDARWLTIEYASPEQARGEPLTTASDIYSLGVVLYELLCGCLPYVVASAAPAELAVAVDRQDPTRPSTRVRRATGPAAATDVARLRATSVAGLSRVLSGDLDGITLMALRKEPGRRYASADMLRQDVERHLAGLPVLAHRGSRRYRIAKFLRRHRIESASLVVVLLALIAALAVAIQQERRTSVERDRAEAALAEARGVGQFLVDLFRTSESGDRPPEELSALDLLARGARRADDLAAQPALHARLLDVLGQLSLHLGRLDEALERTERAVALRRQQGDAAPALATSLIQLARVRRARSDYGGARAAVEEALALRRGLAEPVPSEIAEAYYELGWVTFGRAQEGLYRQALATLPVGPATAEARVTMLQSLSTNLRRQGQLTDAVAVSRQAVTVAERDLGADHPVTGDTLVHLADHVRDIEDDGPAAEVLYRRGLTLITRRHGTQSLLRLHGLNSLASLMAARGSSEAESLAREALAISETATGRRHPRVADQLQRLAGELARQGRLTEAERLAEEALAIAVATVGANHQATTSIHLPRLASIYERQRDPARADAAWARAFRDAPSPSDVVRGQMHREYGRVLLLRGDAARAEDHLLQSLKLLERSYGGRAHPNVQETQRALHELYVATGKPREAERHQTPPGRFIAY